MNWIRQDKRLAIYLRDDFRCLSCDRDLREAEPGTMTLDHLIPHSQGGSNREWNLVTVCRDCNLMRMTKPWKSFYGAVRVERIEKLVKMKLNRALAKELIARRKSEK